VAEEYGISIKQYSDDTAIYLEFGFSRNCLDQFDALRILSMCAGDLIDWFSYNWVKLNPQKSEVLYFAPSELANRLITLPLRVGVNLFEPLTSARVLGVQLSSDLTMDRQISAIVRAANFNRQGKRSPDNRSHQDSCSIPCHYTPGLCQLLVGRPFREEIKTTSISTGLCCPSHLPWRNIHRSIKIPPALAPH